MMRCCVAAARGLAQEVAPKHLSSRPGGGSSRPRVITCLLTPGTTSTVAVVTRGGPPSSGKCTAPGGGSAAASGGDCVGGAACASAAMPRRGARRPARVGPCRVRRGDALGGVRVSAVAEGTTARTRPPLASGPTWKVANPSDAAVAAFCARWRTRQGRARAGWRARGRPASRPHQPTLAPESWPRRRAAAPRPPRRQPGGLRCVRRTAPRAARSGGSCDPAGAGRSLRARAVTTAARYQPTTTQRAAPGLHPRTRACRWRCTASGAALCRPLLSSVRR